MSDLYAEMGRKIDGLVSKYNATEKALAVERELVANTRAKNMELEQKNISLQQQLADKDIYIENLLQGKNGFYALRQANLERAREWGNTSQGFTPVFYAMATAGECGEACNVQKKLERWRLGAYLPGELEGSKATLADLAQEMGDIIIYLDLWAESMGIELWSATRNSFNTKSVEIGFDARI